MDAARTCSWREFNQVLRYWELAGDTDGAEPVEQQARRFCRYRKLASGSVVGSFELDPLIGQALITAIESETQLAFRQDADPSRTTAAQRRADAFAAVVSRGAARSATGPPPTLVHIVMSERVAEITLASLDDPSGAPADGGALDPTDVDGRCELVDGTPLHPRLAIGAMARATLRRLIMRADSQPVDLGRTVRAFPEHLKQALLAAARGRCQASGCDAPLSWLEADHVTPWNRAGHTALGNGQMLCGPHNKAKSDTMPTEPGASVEPPPKPPPQQPPKPPPKEPGQSSLPGGRE